MSDEEDLTFPCGPLRLEGRLGVPEGATGGAVVCHPHPQYGGDMDNSVVRVIAAQLRAADIATLRFNFRGVGASQGAFDGGAGECDDARAAVAELMRRATLPNIALVGYSFGATVALRVGHDHPAVDRLVAVAPPLSMFDVEFLFGTDKPVLLALGDTDQFCPLATLDRVAAQIGPRASVLRFDGADHFLSGFETQIGDRIARFVGATG